MAFVSSNNTSSTKEAVNTANYVSAASSQGQASSVTYADDVMFSFFANQSNSLQLDNEDLEQIDTDNLKEMDLKSHVAMLTMRMKRLIKNTRRNLNFNGKETIGFDKTKVECYNCHSKGHLARECRAPRNQGNRNGDNTRRVIQVETPNNALVIQDGIGSSSSSCSESEVHTCSKDCLKSYETFQNYYDQQREALNKSNLEIIVKDISIKELKNQLENALKEKDDLKLKIEKFETSSKNLTKLMNSQISAKDKTGLGYDSYVNESEVLDNLFDSHESDGDNNQINDRFKKTKGYHAVPPTLGTSSPQNSCIITLLGVCFVGVFWGGWVLCLYGWWLGDVGFLGGWFAVLVRGEWGGWVVEGLGCRGGLGGKKEEEGEWGLNWRSIIQAARAAAAWLHLQASTSGGTQQQPTKSKARLERSSIAQRADAASTSCTSASIGKAKQASAWQSIAKLSTDQVGGGVGLWCLLVVEGGLVGGWCGLGLVGWCWLVVGGGGGLLILLLTGWVDWPWSWVVGGDGSGWCLEFGVWWRVGSGGVARWRGMLEGGERGRGGVWGDEKGGWERGKKGEEKMEREGREKGKWGGGKWGEKDRTFIDRTVKQVLPPKVWSIVEGGGGDDPVYKSKVSETITSKDSLDTTASETSKDSFEKPKTVRPSVPIIED
ncbi:ribonuclease H-like domain-containing protein [Tanacetum coccineum]